MVTKTIDVPLPDSLQSFLAQPVCVTLPPPANVKINLPMGGTLQGMADVTKSIPDDCTLSFSLVLQLQPFLANLDCLLKIVKVLEPLISVVTGLSKPDPFAVAEAMKKLTDAVPPLIECFAKFTGLGVPLFVKDLLCLIIKLLGCVVGQLRTIVGFLGGLSIQIADAQAAGNTELLAALECAQQGANASAAHMLTAIDPLAALLALAEPLLSMLGVGPFEIPALAAPEDLEQMEQAISALDQVVQTMQLVADGLGGCG